MTDTSLITTSEPTTGFRRIGLRTLIPIHWVAIAGQALTILIVHYGLGLRLPLLPALGVVASSVLLNASLDPAAPRRNPPQRKRRRAAPRLRHAAACHPAVPHRRSAEPVDLDLAPVTVAATILSRRPVIALSILAVAAITVLALWHMPLPWRTEPLVFPPELVFGIWMALVLQKDRRERQLKTRETLIISALYRGCPTRCRAHRTTATKQA